MRNFYTTLILLLSFYLQVNGQGLDSIIVEKYYISNEDDAKFNDVGGILPPNSVTYRIFVDMKPDYIFQAIYGVNEFGYQHELVIETSTRFFNNEDFGSAIPNNVSFFLQNNTVLLDSYLSVGAAGINLVGVPKTDDDGLETLVNKDGILLNDDPRAGIPLTEQDGYIPGFSEPVLTLGFDDLSTFFDNTNLAPIPSKFSSINGSLASLNGSKGPNPETNRVFIGQFTTNGVFSFELNLQIRNQLTLGVENYVARNPVNDEILHPDMIYKDSLVTIVNSKEYESYDDNSSHIILYPNPAQNEINIDIRETGFSYFSYELYSLDGRQIIKGDSKENKTQLSVENLNAGIYFININIDGIKSTKKVIIQ